MPELTPPSVDWQHIPAALQEFPQWVLWRYEERNGKTTKPPYTPNGHHPPQYARVDDPSTWRSFAETALALSVPGCPFNGIGFVFSPDVPLVGIDLDHAVDPDGGILPFAVEIVERLNSYTEYSPSGTGLHILCKGKLPFGKIKVGQVEVFSSTGYITMTGHRVAGTPAEPQECQDKLLALYQRIKPPAGKPAEPHPTTPSLSSVDYSDDDRLDLARSAANGDLFRRLYDTGDTTGYPSPSEADLGLCCLLIFWLGRDPARIDAAFRRSALFRPKWDTKNAGSTYGARTITKALELQKDVWEEHLEVNMGQSTGEGHTGPQEPQEAAVVGSAEAAVTEEPSPVDAARQRLAAVMGTVTAGEVWGLVSDLALFSKGEYGPLLQEVKARLGKEVRWGDFDQAVQEARRSVRRAEEERRREEEHLQNLARIEAEGRLRDELGLPAEKPERDTQAKKLIGLALAAAQELFFSRRGDTYAILEEAGRFPCFPMKSTDMRRWLRNAWAAEDPSPPSSEAVRSAIETLDARAVMGREREVYLRLAHHGGKVYVDLGNEAYEALEIDADGWRVVNNPPVAFVRGRGALPLPHPEPGGDLGKLKDFVNVTEENWPLLVSFVVGCWGPGPYSVLSLTGEQGTGKTVAAKVIKALVDPNEAPTRKEPREGRDVMISATHNHLLAYDNLSAMPVWLSDLLCCITSGTGHSQRALYTDADEVLLTAQRPVVLNGIAETVQRSDLLDRSILLSLEVIHEEKRKPESAFWAEFTSALPGILGGLCDAVSTALRNLPTTNPDRLPRMGDFAKWIIAAEPALGIREGKFLAAYTLNRGEAHVLALEGDVLATRLTNYLQTHPRPWEGTSTQLLAQFLPEVAAGEKKDLPAGTPTTAKDVSAHLRRIAPNLRDNGVDVSFYRKAGGSREKKILIVHREGGGGDAGGDAGTQNGTHGTQNLSFASLSETQ